jgi:hypothetical protein
MRSKKRNQNLGTGLTWTWFQVKDMVCQSSKSAVIDFDDKWLSRYPRPECIGYDNEKEYTRVFTELVSNSGLKGKSVSAYNHQSNGIIERVHLTLNY